VDGCVILFFVVFAATAIVAAGFGSKKGPSHASRK
jgi:hypothetical protein